MDTRKIDEDLVTLCQSCGLCCDGTLFGRVTLIEPDEVAWARKRHLRVLENAKGFKQPCDALVVIQTAGAQDPSPATRRTCSVYDERPASCRHFTCRLFERHRREGGPLEPRLAAVRRVRELFTLLGVPGNLHTQRVEDEEAEEAGEGDKRGDDHEEALSPDLYELMQRLEEDFARATRNRDDD